MIFYSLTRLDEAVIPDATTENVQVRRPEFLLQICDDTFAVVDKPLTLWERLYDIPLVRKMSLIIVLAVLWEIYARTLDNPLLFPSLTATLNAFWADIISGVLVQRVWLSIQVLLEAYVLGLALSGLITAFASASRIGTDLLETLTAMFNPLPSIALLPLALIWFGFGTPSMIFVLIHSVLWAVTLNTHSGFQSVSSTVRMVGRNYGLSGPRYLAKILIPAAFPSILTGMKIGWAFAWRTLIAAELVFGASSGSGGLGWYIYENKNDLETANVFAGLLAVILIGLAVEQFVFQTVTNHTIKKWGMQS